MQFFKNVTLNVKSILNGVDFEKKTRKKEFADLICTEMAIHLESGALIQKRCDCGLTWINITLECKVCRKKFKFIIQWASFHQETIEIKVLSDPQICNHPAQQSTRPIKGTKRLDVADHLAGKSTSSFINASIMKANKDLVMKTGNLQDIKSSEVVRQIRSQDLSKHDFHTDPLIDIHLMAKSDMNNTNRFIQDVSSFPFTVTVR
jgi:hypothetical protein